MQKTSNNLIIIGRGHSKLWAKDFLYHFALDADIWRLNLGSCLNLTPSTGLEYHFDIHNPRHHTSSFIFGEYRRIGKHPGNIRIITSDDINISDLVEYGKNNILSNTIVVQMALAGVMGYENIALPGCDIFNSKERDKLEEAGFNLWFKLLEAKGIKLYTTKLCTVFKSTSKLTQEFGEIGKKLGANIELSKAEIDLLNSNKKLYT